MSKTDTPNRTCLFSKDELPQDKLLRFTLTPDRQVVPDFNKRLQGRGIYITNSKQILQCAIDKKAFRRFGKSTTVMPNLVEVVENILKNRAFETLNLARKAGVLVSGFEKVKEKLIAGKVGFVLEALDAGEDGKAKIRTLAKDVEILSLFSTDELDKALNKANTVHLGLLKSEMSDVVYNQLQKWQNFVNS